MTKKEETAPGTCETIIDEKSGELCDKPVVAKKKCATCYQQWRRTGTAIAGPKVAVADIIPLRLDEQLSKGIRAQAKKEDVAVAEWVRQAAREKLEKKTNKKS